MEHVRSVLRVSERRACRVLEQPRSTQRHEPLVRDDEQALTNDIVGLASRFGRYGYRRITALLRRAGWDVNHKRVERIWRRERPKVLAKQPKRGQLWLNDGSCARIHRRDPAVPVRRGMRGQGKGLRGPDADRNGRCGV